MMNKNRFFIYLLVLMLLTGCIPKQDIQIIQAEQRSITVTGRGEINVAPDRARIVFNVVTKNRDVLTAKEQNQQIVSKVLAALKELGVKDTSIKTNFLNLFPESGGAAPLYNATTVIQVTTENLNIVEGILTGVLKSATVEAEGFYFELDIQRIYFEISNVDYYRGQARSIALQDAKAKAITMAGELGQDIGDPISISVQEVDNYSYGTADGYIYYRNPNSGDAFMYDKIAVTSNAVVEFSLK